MLVPLYHYKYLAYIVSWWYLSYLYPICIVRNKAIQTIQTSMASQTISQSLLSPIRDNTVNRKILESIDLIILMYCSFHFLDLGEWLFSTNQAPHST